MKNKGFTLIELLAVIVILAIIALIATPIILGIINDARESARKRSAELVKTGVQYAYTTAMYKDTNNVVTLDNLVTYFSTDNATAVKSGTEVHITTNDNVYCKVTETSTGSGLFRLSCGTANNFSGTQYLNNVGIATK